MRRFRAALVALLAALVVAPGAAAHPVLSPAFLEAGTSTRIVARIPNERPLQATVGLVVSLPKGFAIEHAETAGPWTASFDGGSATWKGGRIAGSEALDVALVVRADAPAGTYDVLLDQSYADGRRVQTQAQLTVLPAAGDASPKEHPGRAIAAAVAGLVVVAGVLVGLRAIRRRRPS